MDNSPLPQDLPLDKLNDGYFLQPQISPTFRTLRFCTPDDVEHKRIERARAKDKGRSEFIAKCAHHGDYALSDTATGACLCCLAENDSLPIQAQYQAAGASCYFDTCEDHGGFVARFGERGCRLCKRPELAPRIMAQRAGQLRYTDTCDTCGPSPHATRSGACVTCHTVTGGDRGAPGRPHMAGNPRAEARRAGRKQYLAICPSHDETEHSVAHGKCLKCFNAMGRPRPS